ncbi:hypothetical protein Vadar_005584 [Vaccinium darrowii]|uniref:Uncharacterized protein n=1 Tax=Vaccinium darrowii TaxID=229202 RepID=A0ACB7Z4B3_9ERIC|nr:hypothetical protein Vadar_005584 [Vaccinium darrowii]
MEETSRSQPIRKRPRKLQPETQQETQEQTQGDQNSNRCSLLSIIRIVKENELNDQHIASLKRTPFWLLFEAIINKKLQSDQCRKFDEVVLKIVQSYQEDTKAFRIGGKNIRLTKNHVRLIFGISCGNKEMVEMKINKEATGLEKRLDIKESRLSTTTIEKKIRDLKNSEKQQDIDDVVRLLCLYLCVMLLFSNKATSVNWLNHRDIKQLKGSSISLLYFLCEHIKLVEVKGEDAVPRLLKWKISHLRKSFKDFEQLSQIPLDKVNNTGLGQTDKETKMFVELSAQVFSVEEDVCTKIEQEEVVSDQDGVRGEENGEKGEEKNEVGDEGEGNKVEETIAAVHLGDQDEVHEEENAEKGEANNEVEENFLNVQGLEDLNTSTYPSYEVNSFTETQETDSGSTLVPNSLSPLDSICATVMEKSNEDAIKVIDELKKRIEILEKGKKAAKIKSKEICQKFERTLESQKELIEMLKLKVKEEQGIREIQKLEVERKDTYIVELCQKIQNLEEINKELKGRIEDYQVHQMTQDYGIQTEREVHQVTQKATAEKIERLQIENEELEFEIINIKLHEITQAYGEINDAMRKDKKQETPPSRAIRVKERDDRKKNVCNDYVYEELKKKSPQENVIELSSCKQYERRARPPKKLKKWKGQTDMTELINRRAMDRIQQIWRAEHANVVVWEVPDQMLHVEASDIQNLLYEESISTQVIPCPIIVWEVPDQMLHVEASDIQFALMVQNKGARQLKTILDKYMNKAVQARFLLFPLVVQSHWTLVVLDKDDGNWKFYNSILRRVGKDIYCGATDNLRKVVADYLNEAGTKANVTDKVEIENDSPQQATGSVDCGIIVISIMKKYLMNEQPTTKVIKMTAGR